MSCTMHNVFALEQMYSTDIKLGMILANANTNIIARKLHKDKNYFSESQPNSVVIEEKVSCTLSLSTFVRVPYLSSFKSISRSTAFSLLPQIRKCSARERVSSTNDIFSVLVFFSFSLFSALVLLESTA